MKEIMLATLFIITVFAVLGYVDYIRYQELKKLMPDLTYQQYVIFGDKIRITPVYHEN